MEREWRISRMRAFLRCEKKETGRTSGHRNRSKESWEREENKYPRLFVLIVVLRRLYRLNSVCRVGRKREADKCLERAR